MDTMRIRSGMRSASIGRNRIRHASRRQYALLVAVILGSAAMLYVLGSIETILSM
jgi:hypothetical protein